LTGIGQQTSTGWQYFNTDGLGSVRQMTDASGAVAYAASYEPYGTPFDQWPNPQTAATVGYTGQQTDSNELVYLRARYYDPRLGVFLSKDPFEGVATSAITQNGYAYAGSNPVNYVDPSGRCFGFLAGLDTAACVGAIFLGVAVGFTFSFATDAAFQIGGDMYGGATFDQAWGSWTQQGWKRSLFMGGVGGVLGAVTGPIGLIGGHLVKQTAITATQAFIGEFAFNVAVGAAADYYIYGDSPGTAFVSNLAGETGGEIAGRVVGKVWRSIAQTAPVGSALDDAAMLARAEHRAALAMGGAPEGIGGGGEGIKDAELGLPVRWVGGTQRWHAAVDNIELNGKKYKKGDIVPTQWAETMRANVIRALNGIPPTRQGVELSEYGLLTKEEVEFFLELAHNRARQGNTTPIVLAGSLSETPLGLLRRYHPEYRQFLLTNPDWQFRYKKWWSTLIDTGLPSDIDFWEGSHLSAEEIDQVKTFFNEKYPGTEIEVDQGYKLDYYPKKNFPVSFEKKGGAIIFQIQPDGGDPIKVIKGAWQKGIWPP
jgi:RHS repeat-associated protein